MIFNDATAEWQDLQTRVCQILTECGCEAERNKHIGLARGGGANIDVHAADRTREPRLLILCECKALEFESPTNRHPHI